MLVILLVTCPGFLLSFNLWYWSFRLLKRIKVEIISVWAFLDFEKSKIRMVYQFFFPATVFLFMASITYRQMDCSLPSFRVMGALSPERWGWWWALAFKGGQIPLSRLQHILSGRSSTYNSNAKPLQNIAGRCPSNTLLLKGSAG